MRKMKVNELMFIKYVLGLSLIILLITFYPIFVYASRIHIYSFIAGYVISLVNVVIGYQFNKTALSKSIKNFMTIVFGSMALRLVLVAIFLLILLTYTKLEPVSLISSVFFFYFLFISLEIYFLSRKSHK